YVDKGDSGNVVNRYFCGTCGSPIYSATPANPDVVVVKAGTLDDTSTVAPKVHLWCDSAWPWTPFPERAIKIAKNPPPPRVD
ncbi:MAG TPA: GFA family protein, partial [Rhizomicrobium sp.]|nr:GFA family protein [Rhizomicrobium sp.]